MTDPIRDDALDARLRAMPRERLPAFLAGLPKAELHIHVEGSLEPELIFALAARNGVALPFADVDALRRAYDFRDLQSFLDIYYAGAGVLRTEADFFDMGMAYLSRAASENTLHAEIFFDPQTHTSRGVPMETVIGGLSRASAEAERLHGISSALILCFLRHLSEEEAFETLEAALPLRDRFVGVGLDSSELGHPPEKFARVFAKAGELGLRRVAHAGEEGPPEYVWQALDLLGAERIDHGVRAMEDPALVRRLAAQRVPLTVCPLSNVKLRVFDRLADHNLRALLDAGLVVTINADDPAYFGGWLNDNWLRCFQELPLDAADARRMAHAGFDASFADPACKARWKRRVEDWCEAAC